ncbi:SDR family oxidoreductase [Butyrivibrio sp. AE3003]|uniref:SDR family oxidoreductase n=1 Tax=Butyrivibrio sp. AE3003 TaxID=1496721 RepID=UPI000479958F|nr:SDR family oxidoreductase [Butyrivibrio sp. AE3003]
MNDRILLMFGASSDIGIRYLEKYGSNYKKVYAHYNSNVIELQRLISEGCNNITPIQCDLLDEKSIEYMLSQIEESGELPSNIVFLPARKTQLMKIEETSLSDIKTDFVLQVVSSSMAIQKFIPYMKEAKFGRICFMLSSVTYQPVTYNYSYMISKYALLGEVKALAKELAPFGITINALSPTMIDTKFVADTSPFVKKKDA